MRTLLISIALLFGIVGYGQISGKDSIYITHLIDTTGIIWMKVDTSSGFVTKSYIDTVWVKPDTTRVIMLVCDTTKVLINKQWEIYDDTAIAIRTYAPHNVTWQYGYAVEGYNTIVVGELTLPHITYLDEHKKPLKKEVIVWQSIEIKH